MVIPAGHIGQLEGRRGRPQSSWRCGQCCKGLERGHEDRTGFRVDDATVEAQDFEEWPRGRGLE